MREDCGPGGGGCCGRRGGGDRHGGGMRGLLEPALLAAIAARPAHGYDLRVSLEDLTAGALSIDAGGLYRVLRRMEDDGLVASTWQDGEHGPQRRTYHLTADGLDVLRCWIDRLHARRHAIDGILAAARAATQSDDPTTPEPATPTTTKEH